MHLAAGWWWQLCVERCACRVLVEGRVGVDASGRVLWREGAAVEGMFGGRSEA